ncbi:MAG: peptidoglycan-binding protein [Acidobacteria bacterium]|nr:peptidoglycan-binding protein [Acidobacteriota bacterium]
MQKILFLTLAIFVFTGLAYGQAPTNGASTSATAEKPKRVSFRPTKDQITEAQTKLKDAGSYSGEANGKYNNDFRAAIRKFQEANGLAKSGSLNRATLEKMQIALTEAQKEIPIPESSYAKAKEEKPKTAGTDKPKRTIFRATKDQINEAQRILKAGGMYSGEETGQLSKETRDGLKKYQEANGLNVTGTLNQATLEKMGIALTDKQKADAVSAQ